MNEQAISVWADKLLVEMAIRILVSSKLDDYTRKTWLMHWNPYPYPWMLKAVWREYERMITLQRDGSPNGRLKRLAEYPLLPSEVFWNKPEGFQYVPLPESNSAYWIPGNQHIASIDPYGNNQDADSIGVFTTKDGKFISVYKARQVGRTQAAEEQMRYKSAIGGDNNPNKEKEHIQVKPNMSGKLIAEYSSIPNSILSCTPRKQISKTSTLICKLWATMVLPVRAALSVIKDIWKNYRD